jgi:hypothetical protein
VRKNFQPTRKNDLLRCRTLQAKNKVTIACKTKDVEVEDEFGYKIKHPGYFWLAYDWKNLMPSCKVATAARKQTNFQLEANI